MAQNLHAYMCHTAQGFVTHYWTDIAIYDRVALEGLEDGERAVWAIRPTGSYFALLTCKITDRAAWQLDSRPFLQHVWDREHYDGLDKEHYRWFLVTRECLQNGYVSGTLEPLQRSEVSALLAPLTPLALAFL